MQFEGQKAFEKILQEAECSRSVHEIYFFLRGLLSGTHTAGPSAWFGWLFEDKEPVFDSEEQAQRLMGNVMGLWNLIASAQQGNTQLPDIREKFPSTVEDIVSRVEIINKETTAFVKGLDFAGTDPMEMTPDGRTAMKALTKSDVMCSQYIELAKRENLDQKESKEIHEMLDQMEAIMEDCIQRVSVSLDEARKTAVPSPKVPQKSEKIPRNQSCPCGSGKKYKKCCRLKLH